MWFISWSVLCLSLPTIYGIGAIYWIGELDSIVYLHNLLLAFEIHLQSVCQQKSEPSTLVKTWGNRETAEHTGTQIKKIWASPYHRACRIRNKRNNHHTVDNERGSITNIARPRPHHRGFHLFWVHKTGAWFVAYICWRRTRQIVNKIKKKRIQNSAIKTTTNRQQGPDVCDWL